MADVKSNRNNNKEKKREKVRKHTKNPFFLFVDENELEMEKLNDEDIVMNM